MKRNHARLANEMRNIEVKTNCNKYSLGSCIINFGDTKVICTANIDEKIPRFLRGLNSGWVSAEYNMIPSATHSRNIRERFKLSGRTQEIQRLISRSLRSSINLNYLEERHIIVDCDVLQADGGTRVASITGGFIALSIAINNLLNRKEININPIKFHIAAISCGLISDTILLDLDYNEDSKADVDANFVLNEKGEIIEVQTTGENNTLSKENFDKMYSLSSSAIKELINIQKSALSRYA